jgi:putative transposase
MNSALFELPGALFALVLKRALPRFTDVEKENLFLRYQLSVLQRQTKRPKFSALDRSILALLTRSMRNWRNACLILQPETLLKWHKALARWKWTTDRRGRRPIDQDLRALIIRMKRENRLWGPKRIHGELLKLGIQVSETTVRNVLRKARTDPWSGKPSENWRDFFRRHQNIWAIDYFTVHSVSLKRIFVLVIMDLKTRTLIATHTTSNPTARWAAATLNEEISKSPAHPDAILHDRDPSFESKSFRSVLNDQKVANMRCPRRTPIANSVVERLQGTLRRECTDHFLFFGKRHLNRVLREYGSYYNHSRPHQGLNQKTPIPRPSRRNSTRNACRPASRLILGGLHHDYLESKESG